MPAPPRVDPNTNAFLQAQPEIGEHTWVPCFDSAEDEQTPTTFHAQCNSYTYTVLIANNALGYTFGGYAEASWGANGHADG